MSQLKLIIGLSILFTSLSIKSEAQIISSDSLALVAIYNATGGPDWTKNENWLIGPVNTWQGITTSGNRVIGLRFDQSGLKDSVPDDIFDLTALKELYLFATVGVADDRFRSFSNLEKITLSNWKLEFEPVVFCEFQNLTELRILGCQGFNEIPICLAQKQITNLTLARMNLVGDSALLSTLASIPTLSDLNLSNNNFTGEIPQTLCQANLRILNLADNDISGEIPACLNQNGSLLQLLLDKNKLSGEIPTDIFKDGLALVKLDFNNLSGNMDNWVLKPSSTYGISFKNNQLSGDINGSFFGDNIVTVDLANNNFTGVKNINENLNIRSLKVNGNNLFFDDLQKLPVPTQTFTYNNQQNVNDLLEMNINQGDNISLTMDQVGDSFTKYQWYLNDQILNNETGRDLNITNADMNDVGSYYCEATHVDFPELYLERNPIELTVGLSNSNTEVKNYAVSLYPNPASNAFYIETEIKELGTIKIFDSKGNLISVLSSKDKIDISHLSNGLYFIEIKTKDNRIYSIEKLMVSK